MAGLVQKDEARAFRSVKNLVDTSLQQIPEAYIRPQNERPSDALLYTAGNIPVIDLSHLEGPNRPELLNAIAKACQDWGFFQVINHRVPERVIERMVEAHHRFFEQPEEEKAKYRTKDFQKPVQYGTSFTAKDQNVLDWRDYLSFIVAETIDAQTLECWPPIMKDAVIEYVGEVKKLAAKLLSALSESLGIPGILENIMGYGLLLLNYYPPCPNPDMTFGLSGHSDVGLLTLLLQDDVGGLQVFHNGQWVAVQPIANAFVINVSDTLQILSNGKFQSAEHRVVPNHNRTRISIPFFCDPDSSTVIKPIPEFINDDNPAKYRSFTFEDYRAYFLDRPLSGKAANLAFARIS